MLAGIISGLALAAIAMIAGAFRKWLYGDTNNKKQEKKSVYRRLRDELQIGEKK